MEFQKHKCVECGQEFEVACQSELDDKLKKHKCHSVNKRAVRTAQLHQQQINCFMHDTTVNRIEQRNFDKLIEQGIIA